MKDDAARTLDVICVGRAAIDLYGEQIGARLEDVTYVRALLGWLARQYSCRVCPSGPAGGDADSSRR